jgi:hypothetical protein
MTPRIKVFGTVAFLHCALTFGFVSWSIGWTMLLLDSYGSSAPVPAGLYIVALIALVLGLPLLPLLAYLVGMMGFSDPFNDRIYWVLPVFNSLFVVYVTMAIVARVRERVRSRALGA